MSANITREKELSVRRAWAEGVFGKEPATEVRASNPYGLSFTYDGQPSRSLLSSWERKFVEQTCDERQTRTVTYTDPATGLQIRIEVALYADSPTAEYVVYLKNTGTIDTPLIESIQSLDVVMNMDGDDPPVVHWANGAFHTIDAFAPRESVLKSADDKLELAAGGGKSSIAVMPYFNLARGDGGVIAAIGWTGEWAASFIGADDGSVSCRIGQARTCIRLHPGEEIRTPRVALVFYKGDRWDGQNVLRRFVLAHHRPSPNGEKNWLAPILNINWGATSSEVHMDTIEKIIAHDLPIEYYWIDAEWYGKGHWWKQVGNWEPKKDLHPHGFRPLADRLNETGRKLLLWFEPERACRNTTWWNEHSEWLLHNTTDEAILNLGNPDARRFVTDFISDRITEWKLGCFRNDFNGQPPLSLWEAADAPDRVGMTEIRYVEGLYTFWDELLTRHPGLIIDNCAGGGTRLDLEMLSRSTPFWRCDGPHDTLTDQCYTWGLMPWIPLIGTSQNERGNDYEFRGNMGSALGVRWWGDGDAPTGPIPADFPWDWAAHTLKQYLEIRKFFYGDYYPLTSYSQADDVWMVYQLNLPESGDGLIVALRRTDSPYEIARLRLRGLDESSNYEVIDLDTNAKKTYTGDSLIRDGLEITLKSHPGSTLLTYRRTQ